MDILQTQLTNLMVQVVLSILGLAATFVMVQLAKFKQNLITSQINSLNSETDRKLVLDAVNRIDTLISDTVIKTNETIVKELKKAAEDGIITKDEYNNIAFNCKEEIMKNLTNTVKQKASEQIADIESYIINKIEVEVAKNKANLFNVATGLVDFPATSEVIVESSKIITE